MVSIEVVRSAEELSAQTRAQLAECWAATANAGGAVGFPFPPVSDAEAHNAVDQLIDRVERGDDVLLVARDDVGVAGWVALVLNQAPLVAHWATVRRLQTHPRCRGRGIGRQLMTDLVRVAAAEGCEQLRLAVRGGMGLEDFYRRLGWEVVGTWPAALRLGPDDDRDEVLMHLRL